MKILIMLILLATPALACTDNPAPAPAPAPAPSPVADTVADSNMGQGYSEQMDIKPDCLDIRNQNDPWCQERRDK